MWALAVFQKITKLCINLWQSFEAHFPLQFVEVCAQGLYCILEINVCDFGNAQTYVYCVSAKLLLHRRGNFCVS